MAKKKRNRQQPSTTKAAPDAQAQELSPEERAARRAQQKQEWAEQKRARDRAASSNAPIIWGGVTVLVVVVAFVGGIVLLAGGGGSSASPTPAVTADPRLGGGSPAKSFDISATDDGVDVNPRFEPNTITAVAGEVFQINVKNDGSSAHNIVIAGLDDTYDTADDWETRDPDNPSNPAAIKPGDTGTVQVKIDKAGTYKFRCLFHPEQQTGTLVLTAPPVTPASSATTSASAATQSPSPTP